MYGNRQIMSAKAVRNKTMIEQVQNKIGQPKAVKRTIKNKADKIAHAKKIFPYC